LLGCKSQAPLKATGVKPGGFFRFALANGKFLPVCVKHLTESGK
jgi:hypothetical protein